VSTFSAQWNKNCRDSQPLQSLIIKDASLTGNYNGATSSVDSLEGELSTGNPGDGGKLRNEKKRDETKTVLLTGGACNIESLLHSLQTSHYT